MTNPPRQLLTARYIAPLNGPLQLDGGVLFEGNRVIGIGDRLALWRAHPDAEVHDYGQAIILPGMMNAHTHLELSHLRPPELASSRLVDWIRHLMTARSGDDPQIAARQATAEGIAQSLGFGVTCAGDITTMPASTRPVIGESAMAAVSFGEVRAMAQRRELLEPRIAAATDAAFATERLRIGISPHAPYSVEAPGYARCIAVADQLGIPLATHLAETTAEAAFLADQTGEFAELWNWLDAFDEQVPRFKGGPIRFAKSVGLLDRPTLLAHVNHCDDAELAILAKGQASVVYCPRTHKYFNHPPHRWREMLVAGINVAVGTDSRASSPDLNVVEELRVLRRLAPEVAPIDLWAMAGPRAATAIGISGGYGTLGIGCPADAAVFDITTADPLAELLDEHRLPRQVWAAGVQTPVSNTG